MKKLFLTLGAVLVFGIASAQVNQSTTTSANRLTVQKAPAKSLNANPDPASTAQETQNNSGIYGAPSTNNGPTMSSTTATGNAGNTANDAATAGTATASPTSATTASPSATSTSSTASKTTSTTATTPRRN